MIFLWVSPGLHGMAKAVHSIVPAAASDRPAVAAPAPADVDESFLAGCRRRAVAWAAELSRRETALPWAAVGALVALLMYSYWPSLANLPSFWQNPQYQHGWIVPVLTGFLLFWRWKPSAPVSRSARLAGFGLLAGSFLLRLIAANFRIVTIDMYTFVPALAGAVLLVGGWSVFRWAWAPIALLIFMYPLPDEAQRYITGPLQRFNTVVATFILQTLGFEAFREGNLIRLGEDHVMNVVDACAGLKMLTIFVWLAAVVIVIGRLEWWENLVIGISAIPIAIISNALRITTAGLLYGVSPDMAEGFHDSTPAAVLMMGLAVGLILLEMKVLAHLFVNEEAAPSVVTAARTRVPAANPAGRPAGKSGGFPSLARPGTAEKIG
jgi:exosortase